MAFKANLVVANVPAARKILFAVMVSLRNPSSPLIATLVSLLIILSTINPLLYLKLGNFNKDEKRGKFHYDSSVYPYICTAVIKGKWNEGDYAK